MFQTARILGDIGHNTLTSGSVNGETSVMLRKLSAREKVSPMAKAGVVTSVTLTIPNADIASGSSFHSDLVLPVGTSLTHRPQYYRPHNGLMMSEVSFVGLSFWFLNGNYA